MTFLREARSLDAGNSSDSLIIAIPDEFVPEKWRTDSKMFIIFELFAVSGEFGFCA